MIIEELNTKVTILLNKTLYKSINTSMRYKSLRLYSTVLESSPQIVKQSVHMSCGTEARCLFP